jgi:F-type H+-transporting ATPase subunit b
MPQFDKVTFFSQLFWLSITFYGFYMITIQTYLPGLARILKVRKKKVEFALKQGSSFSDERDSTVASYENVFVNSANESREMLTSFSNESNEWLNETKAETNHLDLQRLNEAYVLINGELRGKRFVIQQLTK